VDTALNTLIAGALKIPAAAVTPDTSIDTTPAWDSLAHMDLVVTIEEHYGIQLLPDEMVAMRSVGAIASLLQSKGLLQ
jgi:acyl carrier protein